MISDNFLELPEKRSLASKNLTHGINVQQRVSEVWRLIYQDYQRVRQWLPLV